MLQKLNLFPYVIGNFMLADCTIGTVLSDHYDNCFLFAHNLSSLKLLHIYVHGNPCLSINFQVTTLN